MAPTVCLTEQLPVYTQRKQRVQGNGNHAGVIAKYHQRPELRQILTPLAPLTPPESPLWETDQLDDTDSCTPIPISSSSPNLSARMPADLNDRWNVILTRREGLLGIIVRTMALVRRNHLLQQRVNAFRAETRDFIRSVLNNPENRCRQQHQRVQQNPQQNLAHTQYKDTIISSSREARDTVSSPASPDSTSSSVSYVLATCQKSKYGSDAEMVSDESQDSTHSA